MDEHKAEDEKHEEKLEEKYEEDIPDDYNQQQQLNEPEPEPSPQPPQIQQNQTSSSFQSQSQYQSSQIQSQQQPSSQSSIPISSSNAASQSQPQQQPSDGNISSEENVWQDFLKQQSAKGKKKQEGTLVVLGSKTSGKTSLIGQFKKLEVRSGEMKKFLMMRYAYVQLSDSDEDKSENLLHIYQISDAEHCKVLDTVIPPSHMEHLSYMICLDLSKPYEAQSDFNLWMNVIKETQERLLKRLSVEEQNRLKDKIYKHCQFYMNPHLQEAEPLNDEEKSQLELKRNNPEINLSVPIIIVATKADLFKKLYQAEADADDHYDIILSYIRLWSLKYGNCIFTMAKGLKDQARRILNYLDHRIFDSNFTHAPNEVVSLSNLAEQFLFIPSGHDSIELIKTQGHNKPFDDPFETYFPLLKQNSKKNKEDAFVPKSDNEAMFLKHLEFEIQQAPDAQNRQGQQIRPPPTSTKQSNAAVHKFFNHLLQGQTANAPPKKENQTPTNP